jgi:hypothetical protein
MTILHVLNGDSTRLSLELSGVPGAITVWADVLHEGPALANVSAAEWRQLRARYLAGQGYAAERDVLDRYEREDAVLDRYREFPEVVFWLEHDLYDQLLLLRHLHWIGGLDDLAGTRFSLICIGSFPGVPGFVGLGQLRPDQLATLMPERTEISAVQLAEGRAGWEAFCAPTPEPLVEYLRDGVRSLPFMPGALLRHLEDYPSAHDGLSRSERQILQAIASGNETLADIFKATQRFEERIYMGDTTFVSIVRRMASVAHPLVSLDLQPSPRTLPEGSVRMTPTGAAVLAGRADHLTLNGIDRWMGGVHLTDGRWRRGSDLNFRFRKS